MNINHGGSSYSMHAADLYSRVKNHKIPLLESQSIDVALRYDDPEGKDIIGCSRCVLAVTV